jgi:hypothetical protein
MEMIYPNAGEIFYLRLILLRRPVWNFDDAFICDGTQYPTFQLSALAHGYVDDEKEAEKCFLEATAWSTPDEMRFLFACMTMEGFPTHKIFYDDETNSRMTSDYIHNATIIQSIASFRNQLLLDIDAYFKDRNQNIESYGFPAPEIVDTELDREYMKYDQQQQSQVLVHLQQDTPNNEEQQIIFDEISNSIDTQRTAKYFINGQGGCGKTTLAKKVMAYARSHGFIALGCASTGLAATIYEDFYTAHALFDFPVIEDEDRDESEPPECMFAKNRERLDLIMAATVIVWDEFVSNHKELYEAAHRATEGFRGKVLICMGDFRQILPVVKRAEAEEVIQACISSSYLWYEFKLLTLTKNMRLQKLHDELQQILLVHGNDDDEYKKALDMLQRQKNYGDLLLQVGERNQGHYDMDIMNEDDDTHQQIIRFNSIPFFTDVQFDEAIDFLYPNGLDPDSIATSCMLAATNEQCDIWNERIQQRNNQELYSCVSKDKLCEVDDKNGYIASMMTEQVLNKFNRNGIPPHTLNLKVGDVCLVVRNLSKRIGLATNTRVQIISIQTFCIRIKTLGDNPKFVTLPRIAFHFKLPYGQSFTMRRLQFPLRLAYCMTFNKSQGQTLQRVVVDITKQPFTHGHLYVILSRITAYFAIRFFCDQNSIIDDAPIAHNVVYKQVLI